MILITGATGFIGKHLLEASIKQYGRENVVVLTSWPIDDCSFLLHNNYNFAPNFFENSGYRNITTVIHAGAYTPKKGSEANNFKNSYSNITATHHLLEALPPGVEHFIFLSTLDVYGINGHPITEDTPIDPPSLYGQSKYYCEKALEAWAKENNKLIQLLRLGHVYGPGEENYQKIIPETIKKLLRNQAPQIWGTGSELRSFIYIGDVIKAILNSILLTSYVGPVNIVSERNISINALIQQLIRISNRSTGVDYISGSEPGRSIIFDNSKMKKLLCTEAVSLEEGLRTEWMYMSQRS